ncbi:MAG: c-type cytochrome domain-containing protein [Thermoguttaceae bacterium]
MFKHFLKYAISILPVVPCITAGADASKITYEEHVRPVFREHCFACHNQGKATNDLALDSYERIRKGGASGEVVTPGDPDGSYLFSLVTHKDQPHMPPGGDKIPANKIEILRQWIAAGALKDSGAKAEIKKPAVSLAMTAGAVRPEGPPVIPEGVFRQPAVYTPRAGAITALATSPWAPLVAIAGQRQIVLYNTDSSELAGILPFPEGIPYALRFSRSGRLLVAGGGKAASRGLAAVYDVRTGKRLSQVGDELDAVLAADINASQTLIALGGPQKIVRVFNVADGSPVAEIRKHTDWVTAVEFSPDAVLLATADRAGGVWVWEAGTDREFQALEGHKAAVTAMSWRDDSNVLATAAEDGTITFWAMENGKRIKNIAAHPGGATSLQFLHDGRLVSGGRDYTVKLWGSGGNQIRQFEPFGELVMKVAATHDSGRIVAGDWSGEVRLAAVADGKIVSRLAANPPTLEMALQQRLSEAAAARAAAEQTGCEVEAVQKLLAEKRRAAKAAAAAAAAATKAAESIAAEKAALEKGK